MHTDWNINVSLVIHVNSDHARAEHHPVTLTGNIILILRAYRHGRQGEINKRELGDCKGVKWKVCTCIVL